MTEYDWQTGTRIIGIYVPPGSRMKFAPGVEPIPGDGPFERCLVETRCELLSPKKWAAGLIVETLIESEGPSVHIQIGKPNKTTVLRHEEERQVLPWMKSMDSVLRASVFSESNPKIRLVLDASKLDEPIIHLEGLEHLKTRAEAQKLLPAIRFLRDWHRSGRPTLEDENWPGWVARARKALEIKNEHPCWPWAKIAGEKGVEISERNLYRWLKKLKRLEDG